MAQMGAQGGGDAPGPSGVEADDSDSDDDAPPPLEEPEAPKS